MRLFTAIELTDDARLAIAAEQKKLVSALRTPGSLRLVRPEQLHLTLVFIGEVAEDRGADITRAMSGDIEQAPFRMVFGGAGAFPPRGAPRVLYLAVIEGEPPAIDVHRRVSARLEPLGVRGDGRPYHPHLTLGRWRESRPSDRPRQTASRPVAQIEVRDVALFQSRLSSTGPTYTRLAAAHLSG